LTPTAQANSAGYFRTVRGNNHGIYFFFDKMLSFSKVFNLTSGKRDIGFQCSRRWFTIESCGGGFRPAVAIV